MCNESRDCKLKGSLKGYAMLCLSENYRISLNSFLEISSFFNLEIVENSNKDWAGKKVTILYLKILIVKSSGIIQFF